MIKKALRVISRLVRLRSATETSATQLQNDAIKTGAMLIEWGTTGVQASTAIRANADAIRQLSGPRIYMGVILGADLGSEIGVALQRVGGRLAASAGGDDLPGLGDLEIATRAYQAGRRVHLERGPDECPCYSCAQQRAAAADGAGGN